ncbi:MAG: LEPR-XLL domain-containing protein [Phycisphaerae bacterium]|nr:LEPR-XLL domain-containing protein [Phycisphaerae bacterium]
MLGILNRIKDRKRSSWTGSMPIKPPILERLEPRILLSGDGLLNIAPLDPLQDALLNATPQVVRHAELMEAEEQLPNTEQEIHRPLDSSDQLEPDLLQPILTFSADDENVGMNVDSSDDFSATPGDLSVEDVENRTTATAIVNITIAKPTPRSPAPPTEDGSMPVHANDADLSIEYATSIEIRGPPAGDVEYSSIVDLSTATTSDGYAETSDVEGLYRFEAPDLPGLQLADPNINSWEDQVVYVGFDGEQDVIYNGPVSVGPFNVPAFNIPASCS